MLEIFREYAPVLLGLAMIVVIVLLGACVLELREIDDSFIQELVRLERTNESRRSSIQAQIDQINANLERIEGQLGVIAQRSHVLAAHFVPRLKTEQDVRDDYDFSEEVGYGVDIESRFHRELAERPKKGNDVPPEWSEIRLKSPQKPESV